jgi:hypothetical protein
MAGERSVREPPLMHAIKSGVLPGAGRACQRPPMTKALYGDRRHHLLRLFRRYLLAKTVKRFFPVMCTMQLGSIAARR